jgi:hypothetical protein
MDIHANDLDFTVPLDRDKYHLDSPESLQDIFAAAQHGKHFSNPRNFSDKTDIRCFDMDGMNSSMPTFCSGWIYVYRLTASSMASSGYQVSQ